MVSDEDDEHPVDGEESTEGTPADRGIHGDGVADGDVEAVADRDDYTEGVSDVDDADQALFEELESVHTDARSESVRKTAIEGADQRIVELLSWVLDTETRAKIYVYLLANPGSTSEEVAKGTGLYPSTVREALAELHDEERVSREKRASEGAGNNPYEYTAIQPSELVGGIVDQVQRELNTIFTLDRVLDREDDTVVDDVEPVTITVNDTETHPSVDGDERPVGVDESEAVDVDESDAVDADEPEAVDVERGGAIDVEDDEHSP